MTQADSQHAVVPHEGVLPARADTLRGCRFFLTGAVGCLLVLLALVAVPALVATGSAAAAVIQLRSLAESVLNPSPPTAGVLSSQTIVTRIQPLGQLVSTSAQLAKADIAVSIQQGRFGACDHTANHVATGTIEAGIDLTAITENSVNYDAATDTYTLIVPAPTITGCRIDYIDQYERNRAIPTCTVNWDDARQIAQFTALTEFSADAVEGGLLRTAERDTRAALANFISALTGSNVEILFDATAQPVSAGCKPVPPENWEYNQTTRQWVRIR